MTSTDGDDAGHSNDPHGSGDQSGLLCRQCRERVRAACNQGDTFHSLHYMQLATDSHSNIHRDWCRGQRDTEHREWGLFGRLGE